MIKNKQGYKFLTENMRSKYDPDCVWVLGKWKQHTGALEICKSGFHDSPTPRVSLNYMYGPRWFITEIRGRTIQRGDKRASEEMRVVKEIPTKIVAVRFAIACARRTLAKFEMQFPHDDRPRKAIEAAENWVKEPTEANRSAAESAESAAGSAAESAWSAAWSAARSAEIKWRNEKLLEIIHEETENKP